MKMVIGSYGYNVGVLAVNVMLCVCICNVHIATYVTLGQVNSMSMIRIRLHSCCRV